MKRRLSRFMQRHPPTSQNRLSCLLMAGISVLNDLHTYRIAYEVRITYKRSRAPGSCSSPLPDDSFEHPFILVSNGFFSHRTSHSVQQLKKLKIKKNPLSRWNQSKTIDSWSGDQREREITLTLPYSQSPLCSCLVLPMWRRRLPLSGASGLGLIYPWTSHPSRCVFCPYQIRMYGDNYIHGR